MYTVYTVSSTYFCNHSSFFSYFSFFFFLDTISLPIIFSLFFLFFFFFFFNDTATTEIYTLSLPDALPIWIGERLRIHRVERGARDSLRVQGAHQRVGIDDRPARAVDQDRRPLHSSESGLADHLSRLRGERRMQGHEIGFAQQRVEIDGFSRNLELSFLHEGIAVEHSEAEGRGPRRDLARDVAEADQAERPSHEPEYRLARGHFPATGPDHAVVERDLASGREDQRQRLFRHLLDAVSGIVGDDDPGLRSGIQIDGVHPNSVAGDDLALGHACHRLGRDRSCVGVEQGIAVAGLGKEFFRFFRLQSDDLGEIAESLPLHVQRFPDIVRDHHFCAPGHCFPVFGYDIQRTTPATPSTATMEPSGMRRGASRTPRNMGTPPSRAREARCEVLPPGSATTPPACAHTPPRPGPAT